MSIENKKAMAKADVITLLCVGLGFKIIDRIQVDELNECVLREWLKIPEEKKSGLALLITDKNDDTALFGGTELNGFRFQFLQDFETTYLVKFSGLDEGFFHDLSSHYLTDDIGGRIIGYVRKYIFKPLYKTAEVA